MSYKESFLIPKSSFLTITNKKQARKKKNNDEDHKKASIKKRAHFPKKKKQLASDTNAHKLKADQPAIGLLKKRSRLNRLSKARNERLFRKEMIARNQTVSAGYNPEDERKSFFHFFPREDHHIIHRVLDILSKYSDKISWDSKSYEVTFSGKFYPETSLIDMLNFLLDNGVSYRSAEINSRIPRHIEKLIDIFKDYFKIRDANLLPNYIAFHPDRVNRVYRFRVDRNARMFERTAPRPVKRKRQSLGASPELVQSKRRTTTTLTRNDPGYNEDEEILVTRSEPTKKNIFKQVWGSAQRLFGSPVHKSTPFDAQAPKRDALNFDISDDEEEDNNQTVVQQIEQVSPRKLRDRTKIKAAERLSPD